MKHKYFYMIFLAFNIHIVEPKTSFIKKAQNFFRNPENKKMILNIATGAICATGVSLLVVYRHELAQLLWGDGSYYVDPFVHPIIIGDYACKGLEREYKGVRIKQIRVPQQSGAKCGVYALASAWHWVNAQGGKEYVEHMTNTEGVNYWVNECIEKNSLIKRTKGQWLLEEDLWQGVNNLPKSNLENILVTIFSDKDYISDSGKESESFAIDEEDCQIVYRNNMPDIKQSLQAKEDKATYYSLIIGTMEQGKKSLGHWYTVNISVQSGQLEVVVTDSLNIDRTHNEAVEMVIDELLS